MNADDADQNFIRVHLRLVMFKKLALEGRATTLRFENSIDREMVST
jgi:hypothetical protein